eukprot:gnl/TRDRNA2_/TRDRNA2_70389_c0_seq1.p1 gnl/TRDRNA2_/TRDRNA2_70389_c0~~gnl/TRDRNA2_/TRDRNA2_70389_c0_seq1.p1  ORF type:complete len:440 (+),score=86.71 gnl/TRDRNA2_/TRDRNA2_70389_c0_seq1:161-1480(+)
MAGAAPSLRLLGGARVEEVTAGVDQITARELEELRTLKAPPVPVRRTLEATCLLLAAARTPAPRPATPSWAFVQRTLSDAGFLNRVLRFDVDLRRAAPALAAFVAAEYFGDVVVAGSGAAAVAARRAVASNLRSMKSTGGACTGVSDPLTFERVLHANRAAAALFRWCAMVLDRNSEGLALSADEDGEQPVQELPHSCGTPAEGEACNSSACTADTAPPVPAAAASSKEEPRAPQLPLGSPLARLCFAMEDREAAGGQDSPPAPPSRAVLAALAAPAIVAPAAEENVQRSTEFAVRSDACSNPGRYFAVSIEFPVGSADIGVEQEHHLQSVEATIGMRPKLRLQLLTCQHFNETQTVASQRLKSVREFFARFGVECAAGFGAPGKSCIMCRLLLGDDVALCDYYSRLPTTSVEASMALVSPDTLEMVEWLEDNFECCMF